MQIHRNSTVDRITEKSVEFTVNGEAQSAPADMVVYADGTTAAAPVADELRGAGFSVDVVGDAGAVNYIHGAIHSAWEAIVEL